MFSMIDSVTPGNLPMGYDAYLGYVDGEWATAPRLPALFPGARVVSLTVTGRALACDGVDCEPGNVNALKAASWVQAKLQAVPGCRPVVYADLASPGYSMSECIAALLALGITRSQYRILTAHYDGSHVCSPGRGCRDKDGNVIGFTADGTQWTDEYPGIGVSKVDMSLLNDDFFGPLPWVFGPVRSLVAVAGHHSVLLSWSSPGVPSPGAVHHYQVTVRQDGADVPSYPRDVPKGTNPQSWQGGSLPSATPLVAMVRAVAAEKGHESPWVTVSFTTGHD